MTIRAFPSRTTGERFVVLDGLRGLAAMAVIADHVESSLIMGLTPSRADAVDFFFVLSGFVLAHAYQTRLIHGTLSPAGFMMRRLIRFYPLYLLGFALGLFVFTISVFAGWIEAGFGQMAPAIAAGLAFIPAPPAEWSGNLLFPFNGPSWSLFYELLINLLFALSIRWLSWRAILIALPVLAALVWFTVTRHDVPGPGWTWDHVDAALARVGFCFLAGVAVYRFRSFFRFPRVPSVLVFVALLAVFWGPVPDAWRNQYDALAAVLIMPVLVAFAAECRATGLTERIFAMLGALSFGVYVLHVPMLEGLRIVLGYLGVEIAGDLLVFVLAALALVASAIATTWIDKPARAALMRIANRTRAA